MNYLTNLFASSDLIGNVTNLIRNGANLNNPVVLRPSPIARCAKTCRTVQEMIRPSVPVLYRSHLIH